MTTVDIKKADDELQIVFGEVYSPNALDTKGDFMGENAVRRLAYKFMANLQIPQFNEEGVLETRVAIVDRDHNHINTASFVVESFIASEDDSVYIPGSWVVGVHVPSASLWSQIKDGIINGFSFEGEVAYTVTTIELEIPEVISGTTSERDGHSHEFEVAFDDDGNYLGGSTLGDSTGHTHSITRGTVADLADGHNHTYSIIEQINAET